MPRSIIGGMCVEQLKVFSRYRVLIPIRCRLRSTHTVHVTVHTVHDGLSFVDRDTQTTDIY